MLAVGKSRLIYVFNLAVFSVTCYNLIADFHIQSFAILGAFPMPQRQVVETLPAFIGRNTAQRSLLV